MATRPELHIAVAKTKSKASDYNENFEMMMDYCEAVALEDKTYVDTVVSEVYQRNVGEIVASTIPLTDAGLHLLDGSLLSGSGSYSEFVEYISGLVLSYPDLFETEENWQQSVTDYGVCGKFVYDSTDNTVRLPKITGFVESTITPTELGDLTEAGLPNITGKMGCIDGLEIDYVDGAFYSIDRYTSDTAGGGHNTDDYLAFDASRANSIYGNSSTVQPQTIKVLYYIVVSTSAKSDIQVDIDEIATDLNGKADVDLTNINNTAKISISHYGKPAAIQPATFTLGASGANYVAPADGWFCWAVTTSGLSSYNLVNGSAYNIQSGGVANGNGHIINLIVPCKKGDYIYAYYQLAPSSYSLQFYYDVGSESEAQ